MADGDFGGGDFGVGDLGDSAGDVSFGGESGDFGGWGSDVSFGSEGGYGDFGAGLGAGLAGMDSALSGTPFGGFDFSFDSPTSFMDAPSDSFWGDLSNTSFASPQGTESGFGNTVMNLMASLARGKLSQSLGLPTTITNVIANLARGNTKGAAASIATGLLGPLAPFASLVSAITGAPTIGQSIAAAPGMAPGESPVDGSPAGSAGVLGGLGQLGMGLYGLRQANQLARLGQRTGAQGAAQAQLDQLLSGGDITKMPGYQAGEQAIMRSMAAQGYLGSGNMMEALRNYGSDFYNQQLRTLSGLAGLQPGQLEANVAGTQLRGQALNSLLYGASRTNWGNLLRQFGALGSGLFGDNPPVPTGDEGE